jgi:cell wall-associated NlpC family hydrolase
MNSFFCTVDRVAALERAASRWMGTPFLCNSNTPGPRGGVSCQKLVSEIYRECGACDIEVPEVPMSLATFSRGEELLVPFVRLFTIGERPKFQVIRTDEYEVAPGDLLGFRMGKIVHHCGILIRGGQFVHAITRLGTTISNLADPTWGSRLAIAWRPIE